MKVGIITYYWSNNIGALIQSISLKNFLSKNFSNDDFQFEKYLPKNLILREKKSQLKTLNPIKFIKAINKNLSLSDWKKNTAKLPMYSQIKDKFNKDIYIYGSDEIWNYKNPFFKLDNYFFGHNNEKIKIAYAISIGNLEFNQNNIPDLVKKNICSFKKIIVRDENTYNFVNLITQKKPFIGCDPSLLDTPDILLGNASCFSYLPKKNNYLLIYGIFFSKNQIIKIKNYAKKNSLKIISISYYNIWANKNILNVNPNDFVYLIKNSKIVVTSMFHGIMLSYKYQKNFWYSEDPYRKNKIDFFLRKFNLEKRHLNFLCTKDLDYLNNENEYNEWIYESKYELLSSFKK